MLLLLLFYLFFIVAINYWPGGLTSHSSLLAAPLYYFPPVFEPFQMSGRGHHVISSANSSDPAPPAPQDILLDDKGGHHVLKHLESASNFRAHQKKHSRQATMSFAMPNGRIQSVRVSSMRNQVSKKQPPRHPSTRHIGGGGLAPQQQSTTESQPLMSRRTSSFTEGSRLAVVTPPAGVSPAGVEIELGKIASV